MNPFSAYISISNFFVLSHPPECNWVTVWSLTDWNCLFPVCRAAPYHSGEHGACACFWKDIVQILQVCFFFLDKCRILFCYIVWLENECIGHELISWTKSMQFYFNIDFPLIRNISKTTVLVNLNIGSMACPICHWGPVSACGQLSSVFCWWPQMPVPSFATSHVLQRKPLPHSSASFSSTRPWRNSSTWGNTIPLIRTTTWTNSPCTRKWTLILIAWAV